MKSKNRVIFLGISLAIALFLVVFFSGKSDRVFLAQPASAVSLEVNLNDKKPLKKQLYGFNTEQMNAEYNYSEPEYTALVSQLKPQNLRFPGGIVANFYHWKRSGFIENQLTITNSTALNERNRRNFQQLRNRRNGRLSFDEFMGLCQQLGIKPVITLNLYTGSPEESAAWVRYAKEKGYQIAGWELGNEFYLAAYRNKFPSVQTYIDVAKQHAAAIRAVDPNVKLGAVASTAGFHLTAKGEQADYEKAWNDRLGREKFFDAYIVHMYAFPRERRNLSFEQLRAALIGDSDIALTQAVNYYQQRYGDRPLWVTEWNITEPRNKIANTQLHALYCGNFFLNLLDHQNRISLANYHVLAGAARGFPAFSPKTEGDAPGQGRSVKRACFPAFQMIGETIAKSDTLYSASFTNSPKFQGILEFDNQSLEGVKAAAVGRGDRVSIFVSNRTSNPSRTTIRVNGKPISGTIQYRYVANANLMASNGGNEALRGNGKNEVTIQSWNGSANALRIPANSFGVIELR